MERGVCSQEGDFVVRGPRVAGSYLQEWSQLTQKRAVLRSWPRGLLFLFPKIETSKFTLYVIGAFLEGNKRKSKLKNRVQ